MSRHPTRRISAERTIHAAPSAIFAVLADPAQHPLIDGAAALAPVGAAPPGRTPPLFAGAQFSTAMNRRPRHLNGAHLLQVAVAILNRGRLTNTVIEFEPDRRIAWRNFGRHVWRYELSPSGQAPHAATIVRETFDYSTNLAPWLLESLDFPRHNARAMATTLERLDRLLAARGSGQADREQP